MATVILMKVPSKSRTYSNVLTNWLKFRRDARMLRCLAIEPHLYDNPCSSILTLYEDKLNEVTKQISLLSNIQTNLQKHVSLLKQAKEKG